jgi:hypothetical protein
MKIKLIPLLACSSLLLAGRGSARANPTALDASGNVWTYVGSFEVDQGPAWPSNPVCYTGIEAADVVFGAPAPGEVYAISVDQTLAFVTHTAVLDQWGTHTGLIADENYDLQTGSGYNDPVGGPSSSAYVNDGGFLFTTPNGDFNYVWEMAVPVQGVPDASSTFVLMAAGLGLLALVRIAGRKVLS